MPRSAERPLAVIALVVAALGCRTRQGRPSSADEPVEAEPATASDEPVRIVYPAAPGSFVDLVDELAPSVVHIESTAPVKGGPADDLPGNGSASTALGSGFVLDTEGHVVTNDHVIANAPDVRVVLPDGTELAAAVIGRDAKLDVALLDADGVPTQFSPVRLGSSENLKTGEWVLALGNPFGHEVTASAGIVMALGTSDRDAIAGQRTAYGSFLRTDAAVTAGNSGGPLVNTAGEVVGINTALDRRGDQAGAAVPIDRAAQILPMLEKEGVVTRAWLGVFVHPVTRDTAARLGLEGPTGALVSDVIAAGPGARAGIRPGDVILTFDGHDVDHRNLPWLASTAGIGATIPVVVWRHGKRRELELVSEKMPE